MTKKKAKPEILWSVDFNYKENTERVPDTLYEIHKGHKGHKDFIVMYHGICGVYRAYSLEEAKNYVVKDLAKFGIKIS